ncbi:hypothetical protein ACH4U5_38170 [Streptomyces sp. NPDC020858]|uniref:hypothetical protein n=1 Tax=Streptomyces sp. NPDC020858 TaxID=3365097 RepID=UPI0037AF33BF
MAARRPRPRTPGHRSCRGRAVVERLPDGTEHRTGIWYANQKARRDKLDANQLRALAELGVDWAS